MKFRRLGKSDLQLSVIGLGGNTFGPPRIDQQQTTRCILHALELGVNFIDTASIYGQGMSETFIGNALQGRRDQAVIATKFNLSKMKDGETVRERIIGSCEASLGKLRTDRIDLLQIHAPDGSVAPEEILAPLAELVRQGKIRHIGECNYAAWRHMESLCVSRQHGWPELVAAQNHYNLVRRHVELELLPFCQAQQIGFIPYHPLAGGFLTDKYEKGKLAPAGSRGAAGSPIVTRMRSPARENLQDRLKHWAHSKGHTLGELAVAWLLARREVTSVITGVSTPEQVELNVAGAQWQLGEDERKEVDAIAAWDGSTESIEMTLSR